MKTILTLLVYYLAADLPMDQTREEIVVNRTKEFHRVVCQSDPGVWKKFVIENYSKEFQERQMKRQVAGPDGSTTVTDDKSDPIEAKVKMLGRLHDDFGMGKLTSLKANGNDVDLVITSSQGMTGRFILKFTAAAPYLIDGMKVEVGD